MENKGNLMVEETKTPNIRELWKEHFYKHQLKRRTILLRGQE